MDDGHPQAMALLQALRRRHNSSRVDVSKAPHATARTGGHARDGGHRPVRRAVATVSAFMIAFALSAATAQGEATSPANTDRSIIRMDDAKFNDWYTRWKQYTINDARNRFCDKETGEEIGWLISPYLSGFYYGYLVSKDTQWVDMLVNWTDAWTRRAVGEPDGFLGWPKLGAAGVPVDGFENFYVDSMLGEAMALRPVVLMSAEILRTPALKAKYGDKAQTYLRLSEQIYEKWDSRGAWRETENDGIISVVLPFGIDRKTGGWTDGYQDRRDLREGFSHPNNKANLVAMWLLAMSDATEKPVYRERAEKWFRLMKSRMKLKGDGTYDIWSYWSPAGAWDYKSSRRPKHWVGVHPNGGYYQIDVEAIVTAYEHGVVFTRDDIRRLIQTSLASDRHWTALVRYDATIQKEFERTFKPDSWIGLATTPWYLMLQPG